MDVDATITTDINAITGGGQQHSEAKKAELMRSNLCFYCEKQGHQARNCHKKQADRGNHSGPPYKETVRMGNAPVMPDFQDPDSVTRFLKDNMDSLDESTKLSIIKKLMPKDFTEARN